MIVNGINNPFLISEKQIARTEKHQGAYNYNRVFCNFFEELHAIAVSRFSYQGMPKEIDKWALEDILFSNGAALFIKDSNLDKYGITRLTLAGEMNIYGVPEIRYSYATPNWYKEYDPGNSVIVRDNPTCYPLIMHVYQAAQTLTKIYLTRMINLDQMKTPSIIPMSVDDSFTMECMINDLKEYKPIMKVNSDFGIDKIKALNLNPPILFDKLSEELRQEKAAILTKMGINVSAITKKERVQAAETDANNGEIIANRWSGLQTRSLAVETINEMYGLDISVTFSSELYNDVIGFLGSDFKERNDDNDTELHNQTR